MLLILIPSYLISWWIGLVAGLCSFIIYQICMRLREKTFESAKVVREYHEVYPFDTVKDWKDHEAHLAPFRLPTYENSRFVPVPPGAFRRILNSAGWSLTMAAIHLMFAIAYASAIVIWPLWIIVMSLSSPRAVQAPAAVE